jgi:hypothetical protein
MFRAMLRLFAILIVLACAGCAGGKYATRWDGRRGYDGNGDYGYDLAASRSEARSYVRQASRDYPAPGPQGDPWGPYIHDAAARFKIPDRWIREVMRQESSFRQYDSDGSLMTSSAGAMGLMQVMPRTYDTLRQRYGLGGDPYEPRDNILAGAAYIREMYEQFGSPGFLAAYNAGPDRLQSYLTGGNPLPDETVNYLARIAPRLGTELAMSGPLATYGGGAAAPSYAVASSAPSYAASDDPSDRAFDGGGLVTRNAPTGVSAPIVAARYAPPAAPAVRAPTLLPVVATTTMLGGGYSGGDWGIQVGAYPNPASSQQAVASARARLGDLAGAARPAIMTVDHGGLLYRARLVGLSADRARAACGRLVAQGGDCFPVPPGS